MKNLFKTTIMLLLLAACSGNTDKNSSAKTSSDTSYISPGVGSVSLCFQRLEGTSNQDTATLELSIEGNDVTGIFNHVPHEKDSRKGTINGTRNGNLIKGTWAFMQEGMNDTLSVEFKLEDEILLQKAYAVDRETGRQYLTDTAGFTVQYTRIDCRN